MAFLQKLNNIIWGVPTLILILGIGIALTAVTRFAQFRFLPRAFGMFLRHKNDDDETNNGESPIRALCTALAATVGTGNLAGVAGAIAIGGPGAVFWIWACGIFGMITKFAEAVLAVHYRVKGEKGEYLGGPMYVITLGMPKKYHSLAYIYCIFGIVAAFGVGNATQINTLIGGINSMCAYMGYACTDLMNLLMGIGMAILVSILFLGGAKRVGAAAETLIPFASVLYVVMGIGVFICRFEAIPKAFEAIFAGAFSPNAVTGGMVGSAMITLRIGASRGVFTNEAGMGTAGIAHAAAKVVHPVEQGFMGLIEVFVDTLIICTITALVILCSGVPIPYGEDTGIILTLEAFSGVYGGWVTILLTGTLCCFAFATVLGWGLYGARCAQFLFGEQTWSVFVIIQAVAVVLGSILDTGTIWLFADTINGLMAIPNLLSLFYLLPKVRYIVKDFEKERIT
ncbi:MAG: sodium:alanine symporter family protein [Ruminococcaceae bacterium]|nr:sodium:alanine symporter family protein [Oscillospiraceae bacterium]